MQLALHVFWEKKQFGSIEMLMASHLSMSHDSAPLNGQNLAAQMAQIVEAAADSVDGPRRKML